jgi:hypothetical protein
MPNLPDITPDFSGGMPGAQAVAQLLGIAGMGQLGSSFDRAREMADANAQRAAQQQQMAQQAAAQEEQRKAQQQGRLLELAQVVPDGETFMKLAPIMAPNLTPAELTGYATFADETSRIRKEEEKRVKAEKEASRVAGFIPGMTAGIANLPTDQRAAAIAGIGEQAQLPPGILDYTIQSELARKAEKAATEAAKNARASRTGPLSTDELVSRDAAREDAKADRKRTRMQANEDFRRAKRRGASERLATKYADGKPGVFADPMIIDIPREGGVEAQNKLAGTVQAMELLTDLRALAETVAKHGKGGIGKETLADVGRRTGNPAAFASAFSAARSAVISLQAKARSGLQLNETELKFLSEALPLLSETVLEDGKLAKGVEARLRVTERELESGYWAGTEPRISRANGPELRKLLHKQKQRARAKWEHFLSSANQPSYDEIDQELGE